MARAPGRRQTRGRRRGRNRRGAESSWGRCGAGRGCTRAAPVTSATATTHEPAKEIAAENDVTPAQLAIAWVLAQGEDLVPIPGTKRRTYLEQNATAVDVDLAEDDLARIEAELPEAAGERYDEAGMRSVNR
ncbi:aldo/keto reductase [Streptomyces sp. NRRL S-474]|uniref:aldo/keto reductase n=1 Tax=Streptomyces sp. NRRL S-474 TaxID=1463909 RepID=UPI001F30F780|nr:aldo/keto reductase [Streptomyces sp. NRRL S-474]